MGPDRELVFAPFYMVTYFCVSVCRTDFYLLMKEKHEKLGFPPGQALKILVNVRIGSNSTKT